MCHQHLRTEALKYIQQPFERITAASGQEMCKQLTRVAALQRIQHLAQCARQLVAYCCLGRERKLDTNAIVLAGRSNANMLDIQQVAEHNLEQHAVVLTDREHSALGLLDMIERKVECERQAVSADICDSMGNSR